MNLRCKSFQNSQCLQSPQGSGRPFKGALLGRNKQWKTRSLTTSALKAHGGSDRLEVVRIFMSAVSEAALTIQARLLLRTSARAAIAQL